MVELYSRSRSGQTASNHGCRLRRCGCRPLSATPKCHIRPLYVRISMKLTLRRNMARKAGFRAVARAAPGEPGPTRGLPATRSGRKLHALEPEPAAQAQAMPLTPPSLTLGLEEEYLLVDPASRDLVAAPPAGFMQRCQDRLGERVTHELLQAQVEVGTTVCQNVGAARRAADGAARDRRRHRARVRHGDDRRLDPSVRQLARAEEGRQGALPGARARHADARLAPGDLRHARARRHRGRGAQDRPDEPGDLLPAAPAGAVELVAVLAGPAHRAQGVSADHLRRPAAQRPARVLRERRGVAPHAASARADRPVRRRHQDLVGHPAERPLPDPRDARLRHLHPSG